MKVIGYARISSDQQDLEKQEHLLYKYAQQNKMLIDEMIKAEVSSRKNTKQRKIDELLELLSEGDLLLVAELSRLGRNMLETLNIINNLSEKGIKIIFVNQPELSTSNTAYAKLLLAIYSYFAEAERDYISIRTKQGLAAAKAKGVKLGRRKGSKNKKSRRLDPYNNKIKDFLKMGLSISSIWKIILSEMNDNISYNSFLYYVEHDKELRKVKEDSKDNVLLKEKYIEKMEAKIT